MINEGDMFSVRDELAIGLQVDGQIRRGIPTFVLGYDGKQVGAAHGSCCYIILIEVFDEKKGHRTKFVELRERYG